MSSPSPFTTLSPLPEDPIFAAACRAADAGPDAINGTIGVILEENGEPHLFPSVRTALKEIDAIDTHYPPLAGLPAYREVVSSLVFGKAAAHAIAVATAGGTGALSVLLRTAHTAGYRNAIMPTPSWANHERVIVGGGFSLTKVPYIANGTATFDALHSTAMEAEEPCILVLQAGCHNPTGLDPDTLQWQELAHTIANTQHTVLLDFPYQGFGHGVAEDTLPVQILVDAGVSLLVAWSASKNHSLYGLRTGAALGYSSDETKRAMLLQHLTIANRSLLSVAPRTGQQVVATVQNKYREVWEDELRKLRTLLNEKRTFLTDTLPQYREAIANTHGMFVMLPLAKESIEQLAKENIFLTPDGRINIAGISLENIKKLGTALERLSA